MQQISCTSDVIQTATVDISHLVLHDIVKFFHQLLKVQTCSAVLLV